MKTILTIFGTRPELIKLAPIIREIGRRSNGVASVNVNSGQHRELLQPFIRLFGIHIDFDLRIMEPNQAPGLVCSRAMRELQQVVDHERPDLVLIQGDTTTALAGALIGFYAHIPVGHVEAGLRSGCATSPFPEEMNRRVITKLATYHFAATERNRATLLTEGVSPEHIFLTGNPVVDALTKIAKTSPSPRISELVRATASMRRIVLTTHRRESFGPTIVANLRALRGFVNAHEDVALIFPVHPNPEVTRPAMHILRDHPRVHLLAPLAYQDFIALLAESWLIVSDSGGVQEEAPTLGKPVLVLRENTERPEAVEAGVARVVGGSPEALTNLLEQVYWDGSWIEKIKASDNPFGRGDAAVRIVNAITAIVAPETAAVLFA